MFYDFDVIVVGGGFYGCSLAISLSQRSQRVLLVEKESDLLMRASYANQARIHNGYHYPRSLVTAIRSATNFPRFIRDYRECVDRNVQHIYAIARGTSKVSAYQFRRFCEQAQIPTIVLPSALKRLFNPALIEEAIQVEESTFNAAVLRRLIRRRLDEAGVRILNRREVIRLQPETYGMAVVLDGRETLRCRVVFSCTYSQTNRVLHKSGLEAVPLKHELAEIALIEMPPALREVGITVMDGPFFSTLPFTAEGLHSLTHVTYTPHHAWADADREDATAPLPAPASRFAYMLRDAQRYVPLLSQARYVRSLFEVKTVLPRNEVDDGRPILCCQHDQTSGLFVVLGSKIDNVYDVLSVLEAEGTAQEALQYER